MRLLIDAGNTRIKWALVDEDEWVQSGILSVERANELPQLFLESQKIQQIWVSNVAGEKVAQHVREIGVGKSIEQHFVVAQKDQCGVRNSYSNPSQLGSDRWAALIAAWHQVHGVCLMVSSGTATTIDALSGQGEFSGGLILPGVELMQRSLLDATGQLKSASAISGRGGYMSFPMNSADAIYSGAIQASCGAIERQFALLNDESVPVILSGGAAELLLRYLDQKIFKVPPRVEDNLVLQGLLLMAQETNAR
jgi:type III pantothenate kinase